MLVYCGTATLRRRMKIATMTITIVITIAVATILRFIVAETNIHLDSLVSNATSRTTGPNRNRNWDKFISKPTIVRPNDDDSFRLENLASQGKIICGKYKCFFPLKNQIDMAYIVQQEPINGSVFHLWSTAWQFGLKIEKKHSLRHLAITPPETIKITKSFANRLNTNLTDIDAAGKHTRRYHEGDVVVQKVRIMPTPSLLFGCGERKNSYFFNNWETKLLAFVNDKKTFRQNLEDNIRTTRKLMKSQESCLSRDFQVFVDTCGDMYHLDLDRCFTEKYNRNIFDERKINNTIKCLASLKRRLDKTLLINSHSL